MDLIVKSSISLPVSLPRVRNATLLGIPLIVGIFAAFAMLGMYILVLTVLQDFAHAMQQAGQDRLWVGLVAIGFGTQIGLYTYLRVIIHAARASGATAVTGAGAGTSTLGMLACCAHHLTDLAPLVSLTGAAGLSGIIGFLTEWKYAFIALGLVMNAIGIAVTIRAILKSKRHLNSMQESEVIVQTAPACHQE